MFARSTTFMGDPGKLDAGLAYIRDKVMPVLTDKDGWIGLSVLVNRDSGRMIATSSWASEEAMTTNTAEMSTHRSRVSELVGGGEAQVDHWEIAVMHREHDAHEGRFCRVTWTKADPSQIDSALDFYKQSVMTRLEEVDGFCSTSLLIDRSTGRGSATVRFDSREALEGTRDMAAAMRAQLAAMGGVEFTDIDEMDLAIAHLRVPELV